MKLTCQIRECSRQAHTGTCPQMGHGWPVARAVCKLDRVGPAPEDRRQAGLDARDGSGCISALWLQTPARDMNS